MCYCTHRPAACHQLFSHTITIEPNMDSAWSPKDGLSRAPHQLPSVDMLISKVLQITVWLGGSGEEMKRRGAKDYKILWADI